jgi:hypothetical protein
VTEGSGFQGSRRVPPAPSPRALPPAPQLWEKTPSNGLGSGAGSILVISGRVEAGPLEDGRDGASHREIESREITVAYTTSRRATPQSTQSKHSHRRDGAKIPKAVATRYCL